MRLRNAILRAILQENATVLIRFGSGIVIARLLAPQQVGTYAVALAAVSLAFAVKDSGLSSYVISDAEKDEMLLRSAFGLTLVISAILVATFAALSRALGVFYDDPALGGVLLLVAIGQIPAALVFPATIELTRELRFDVLLVVNLAGVVCQSAISMTLAFVGFGAAALGWGYLLGMIATGAATAVARADSIRLLPSLAQARQLLTFGGWLSVAMLVSAAGAALPQLMIGRGLGLDVAGLFSRAQNLVWMIRDGFFFAVMRPLLPRLTEEEHDGQGMSETALRAVESVTGLAWPAYAMLAVWAEPLIRLLYGPAWSTAGALILPLAIANGLTLTVAPYWEVLIVKRRVRLLFFCEFCAFIVLAALLGAGLLRGVHAALWGLVVARLFFAALFIATLTFRLAFPAKDLLGVWGRSLALTVAVMPPLLLFRLIGAESQIGTLVEMAASGALSALVWMIGLRLSGHELHRHVGPVVSELVAGLASRLSNRRARRRAASSPVGSE